MPKHKVEKNTAFAGKQGDVLYSDSYYVDEGDVRVYDNDKSLGYLYHKFFDGPAEECAKFYGKDGKLSQVDTFESHFLQSSHYYDHNANVIKEIYYSCCPVRASVIDYKVMYDSLGMLKYILQFDDGEFEAIHEHRYIFDNNDNWVLCIIYRNDYICNVIVRELEYYSKEECEAEIVLSPQEIIEIEQQEKARLKHLEECRYYDIYRNNHHEHKDELMSQYSSSDLYFTLSDIWGYSELFPKNLMVYENLCRLFQEDKEETLRYISLFKSIFELEKPVYVNTGLFFASDASTAPKIYSFQK